MRALVTGGAGFIGSHLVDNLLGDGHAVIVLDNFDGFYPPDVKRNNLVQALAHPEFCLIEGDIRDRDTLDRLPDFDVVIHLAALAGVRPSLHDPIGFADVNVRGTMQVLELARRRGVRQFVFASSSSVYGVNPNVPWREDDAGLMPISPYAGTKVSGELLGHVYSHLYGIRFVALRFFTVFGPRQRPDLAIRKFVELMQSGQPIPMFGDGGTRRDYSFVADIVAGIRAAIEYTKSPYEVINLGCGSPVSLLSMIAALETALGVRGRIEKRAEQPGDVPQTFASIEKARRLLGYNPRTSFQEGIGKFIEWLHRDSNVRGPA